MDLVADSNEVISEENNIPSRSTSLMSCKDFLKDFKESDIQSENNASGFITNSEIQEE